LSRQLISKPGHERLTKELEHLRKVERPANVQAIAEARAHGDLSENAEFHAAKERQAVIMSKISEIERFLATCEVIHPLPSPNGRVVFGARVTVYDVDSEDETTYQILGPAESDPNNGCISLTSPIAQALIGKEEGDEVKFKAPGGLRTLEIVAVE
jgi:transcription elongation factor GreA